MVAVTDGSGASVHLELWEMPIEQFGHFMLLVPPPLGIGTVKLDDGSVVKGFICEGWVAGVCVCWGGGLPDIEYRSPWGLWCGARGRRAGARIVYLTGVLRRLLLPAWLQAPARTAPPTSRTSRTSAPGSSMLPDKS